MQEWQGYFNFGANTLAPKQSIVYTGNLPRVVTYNYIPSTWETRGR